MGKVKAAVKNNWIGLAITLITTVGGVSLQYLKNIHDKEVKRQDDYEVYISDYQDKIECQREQMLELIKACPKQCK